MQIIFYKTLRTDFKYEFYCPIYLLIIFIFYLYTIYFLILQVVKLKINGVGILLFFHQFQTVESYDWMKYFFPLCESLNCWL